MRRFLSSAGLALVLTLAGVRPLAAQATPIGYVGPVRQWTFDQCFQGTIPNADRSGVTTGQAFCLGGFLTVAAQRTYTYSGGETETWIDWIVTLTRQTFAPGVGALGLDLDSEQQLTFERPGVWRLASRNVGGTFGSSLTFPMADCWGSGCSRRSSPVPVLEQYTPLGLRLGYDVYLDAPCYRPGPCGPIAPLQLMGTVADFTAVVVTPEPSTWALLGTGLLAIGGTARRWKRAARS
jgi:hypothetical protein